MSLNLNFCLYVEKVFCETFFKFLFSSKRLFPVLTNHEFSLVPFLKQHGVYVKIMSVTGMS